MRLNSFRIRPGFPVTRSANQDRGSTAIAHRISAGGGASVSLFFFFRRNGKNQFNRIVAGILRQLSVAFTFIVIRFLRLRSRIYERNLLPRKESSVCSKRPCPETYVGYIESEISALRLRCLLHPAVSQTSRRTVDEQS